MVNHEKKIKRLQSSIQTFKEIIEDNYLYIDKTKHIHHMLATEKACFMSRPRRFGKSLTCSTLEQIFSGNKELFKDLFIYDSDYKWKKYPVIKIDMSGVDSSDPDEFKYELTVELLSISKQLKIPTGELRTPSSLFKHLILELSTQEKVVIIIDEYDSPILSQITNPKAAKNIRETLRSFYKILKTQDKNIRFTFVTGVSKFSKTSLFSGANHLADLTMLPNYADMFGYTQKEVESYFKDYIEIAAQNMNQTPKQQLKELKHWYNGYRFSTEEIKIYNPFSVLSHFNNVVNNKLKRFKNYWFSSGTPTFLLSLIKKNQYNAYDIDKGELDDSDLDSFDIENIDIKILLFQAGYTTVTAIEEKTGHYIVGYPNHEAKLSMIKHLIRFISLTSGALVDNTATKIRSALLQNDMEKFIIAMENVFVKIPYPLHPTGNIAEKEWFYQSIFFIICDAVGFPISAEELTNVGRIDAVVTTDKHIYIFEFKIDSDAQKALNQIKEKRYYEKYEQDEKEIVLVGINFDTTLRNIKNFIVELP